MSGTNESAATVTCRDCSLASLASLALLPLFFLPSPWAWPRRGTGAAPLALATAHCGRESLDAGETLSYVLVGHATRDSRAQVSTTYMYMLYMYMLCM